MVLTGDRKPKPAGSGRKETDMQPHLSAMLDAMIALLSVLA